MWRTSPLWRTRMRRTALDRAMRWRAVCGRPGARLSRLWARWWISGVPRIGPVDRTGSWIRSCTGIGFVARAGSSGRLLRTRGGLGACGGLLWTRRAVSAGPGCRSGCWPGRRLRLPIVLRFWLILRMQCGWQHCGETTEEEAVQQPGRPYFHRHYSLSGIWNVESVCRSWGKHKRAAFDLMGLDAVFWRPEIAVRNDGGDRLISAISGGTQQQ